MCLITRFPIIKTKRNITVYKVIKYDPETGKIESPFVEHQYYLYKLNYIHKLTNSTLMFGDAWHQAYRIMPDWRIINPAELSARLHNFKHLQSFTRGFHCFKEYKYAKELLHVSGNNIVRCTIPKGSEIAVNYKEIVSNKLILEEILI